MKALVLSKPIKISTFKTAQRYLKIFAISLFLTSLTILILQVLKYAIYWSKFDRFSRSVEKLEKENENLEILISKENNPEKIEEFLKNNNLVKIENEKRIKLPEETFVLESKPSK
jgi:TusA-related sulfurtransferase